LIWHNQLQKFTHIGSLGRWSQDRVPTLTCRAILIMILDYQRDV
jgi:hypothetical protein